MTKAGNAKTKKLARELAKREGLPYREALRIVIASGVALPAEGESDD